jgi:flagellar motor switch protein FliN/FliY
MTGKQTQDQAQQVFSSAFCAALVGALTDASGSPWLVAALPDAAPPADVADEAVWVQVTLEGGLPGAILLEVRRAEAALLASKCLRQPRAEYSPAHAQAFLQMVEAACSTFSSTHGPQYSGLAMRAAIVPQPQSDPGGMLETTIADGDGSRVSITLYLAPALAEALSAYGEGGVTSAREPVNLDLVMGVELNVTLRFGQRKLTLREVLDLTSGSVIELDRQVEEPVELLLEGKVIARGEAVVIDGNYGLRVTEVPKPANSATPR